MLRKESAHTFQLTGDQSAEIAQVFAEHIDGEPVSITAQGDGSIVIAFSLATIEISTSGTVTAE